MQLSEIRNRVRSLASIRSASLLPDSDIDEAVNEFNYQLLNAYDWPQLAGSQLVTASSRLVAFPGQARDITGIQLELETNGFPQQLRAVGQKEFDGLSLNQTGMPELFLVDVVNRRVTLYPAPESAVSLRVYFTKLVSPLVEATDSPVFAAEFHTAWAQAAAATVMRERGGDLQRAAMLDARVLATIARMRKRFLMNADRQAMPLPDRWS